MRARELSEAGIRCGVQADHTYVKVTGNAGPDLRFSGRPGATTRQRAIVGRHDPRLGSQFRARVLGGAGATLLVVKDGATVATVPITDDDFVHRVPRGRQRPLAPAGHERPPDPDGLEPDLDRAGLRALELGGQNAVPPQPLGRRDRAQPCQAAGGGAIATLNGLFGPAISVVRSGVASPQPVSGGMVVVP